MSLIGEQYRPLYDEFSKILATPQFAIPLQGSKVAVACSGGADSLALSLLLEHWCSQNNKELIALIVDHNLRSESAEEALFVQKELGKFGIASQILTSDGDNNKGGGGGRGGLQARARDLRYRLLLDYCEEHSIGNLCVGHHLRDQAETFLLRLRRGSHIKGLGCMDFVSQASGTYILRPLLEVQVDSLRQFVHGLGAVAVEDPSNDCDDFERVRMRKLLPLLAEVGLDDRCFGTVAKRMRVVNDFIDLVAGEYIEKLTEGGEEICGSRDLWRGSHELLHYILLSHIWGRLVDRDYPPRARSFDIIVEAIISDSDSIRELGGVKIICEGEKVKFCRK